MRKSSTCGFDFTDYGMLGGFPAWPRKPAWFWSRLAGGSAIGPDNGPGAGGIAVERVAARAATAKFSKIVLASPSEFPYSTSSHGGVAQLGERLTGSQEVRGSIPLVSTRALNEAPTQVGAFFHIGTQGQRRHHDPPGRQDRALNGRRVHGSISRRGATLLYMEVLHYLCNH